MSKLAICSTVISFFLIFSSLVTIVAVVIDIDHFYRNLIDDFKEFDRFANEAWDEMNVMIVKEIKILVRRVLPDRLGSQELREIKENPVCKESKDTTFRCFDHELGHLVREEATALLGLKGLQVFLANRTILSAVVACLDLLERMVTPEIKAKKELLEHRELQALEQYKKSEHLERQVLLELKDHGELLENLANQEHRASLDRLEFMEPKDVQAKKDQLESQALRVLSDLLDQTARIAVVQIEIAKYYNLMVN
ncbi:unnamed protein product [Caenorhabditis auriculariae]|uniref:Nematode cuticle collagen N-terminal domain-containing protein n=1 Tax=Caenorhabditis auriculariae TaxID=2777116 RepID=A0A8S1HP45_9PELO|nr:unnamed protein product [Caenorhabditis auriculariae]